MSNKNNYLRLAIVLLYCLFLTSCRVGEGFEGVTDDSHFLFIPVSIEYTIAFVFIEIVAFVYALIHKKWEHGWYSDEITRDIRDTKGNLVGTLGTGKFTRHYKSPEKAAKEAYWIRLISVSCLTVGAVVSWIFPILTFWHFLFWIVLSFICIYCAHTNEQFGSCVWIWEKIFLAICVICAIVYCIIAGS